MSESPKYQEPMRILVVDDDSDCLSLTCKMLELEGHEVLRAEDGMRAFEVHKETPAELWVVDIFMPRWDGLEVIKRVREEFPNLPLVCMSAAQNRTQDYSEVGMRFGADARVSKPFSPDELFQAIEDARQKHAD